MLTKGKIFEIDELLDTYVANIKRGCCKPKPPMIKTEGFAPSLAPPSEAALEDMSA